MGVDKAVGSDKKAKYSNLGGVLNLKEGVMFDFGDAANAVLVLMLRREIDELLAARIVDDGEGAEKGDKGWVDGQKYQQELRRVVLALIGK